MALHGNPPPLYFPKSGVIFFKKLQLSRYLVYAPNLFFSGSNESTEVPKNYQDLPTRINDDFEHPQSRGAPGFGLFSDSPNRPGIRKIL